MMNAWRITSISAGPLAPDAVQAELATRVVIGVDPGRGFSGHLYTTQARRFDLEENLVVTPDGEQVNCPPGTSGFYRSRVHDEPAQSPWSPAADFGIDDVQAAFTQDHHERYRWDTLTPGDQTSRFDERF